MKMRDWFVDSDIPIEVLSRLPTKTLHKLRRVSKEWDRLISDRCLVQVQTKKIQFESISGFFFQARYQWCDDEDIETISYIPVQTKTASLHRTVLQFLPESVVIISSSNGLICCRSCFPCAKPKLYICNPLNREFVSLQFPAPDIGKSLTLTFDPSHDPIDVSTNFKLVRVCQTETDTEESLFSFDIYSSKTGSWERMPEICKCDHNLFKNKGIFVEQNLYWLTDGDQIIMLDLKNELSLLIMEPVPISEFNYIPEMCIGDSEGQLHYVLISEYGFQLWVLKDHFASQWELKHSEALDKLEEENSQLLFDIQEKVTSRVSLDMIPWIDPLVFKDGLLLMRVSTDILLYHFQTETMRKLTDLSVLGPNSMISPIVLPYAMSLVPLDQEQEALIPRSSLYIGGR